MSLLKDKTPLKMQLNKTSREINKNVAHDLACNLISEKKLSEKGLKKRFLQYIERDVKNVKAFGKIPYTYLRMGNSPRIIPKSYGDTINSAKRVVRDYVYTQMGKKGTEIGYHLVDLDLKSCFTSILLGLYPDDTRFIQFAIEKVGLWKNIEGEFIRNEKGDKFNKPAVKICVYSSYFFRNKQRYANWYP